jgi:hypothetical protein
MQMQEAQRRRRNALLFIQSFRMAAKRGQEALRPSADGGHEAAIEIWSAVFGEPFPGTQSVTPNVERARCGQHYLHRPRGHLAEWHADHRHV